MTTGATLVRAVSHAVVVIAFAGLAELAHAETQLNCSAGKMIIISEPSGDTSSTKEEHFVFRLDETAKILTLLDGTPLAITRLDRLWITADRDNIFYEFNRGDASLTYASSTTKGEVTTTIVGS